MMLLTKALRKQLPPLHTTENEVDPLVVCRFFCAECYLAWYAIGFDGDDLFYGFVDGNYSELEYFTHSQLIHAIDEWGLPIKRDRHFKPCRLSDLRAELGR